MEKNCTNKKAYSFVEILIVFVIIGLIAVFSVPIFKKNFVKKNTKIKHGLYACTIFDNEEYYFFSKNKKSEIPTQKEHWIKGKCGSAFVLPTGLMTVKLFGGGGAGGNGSGGWSNGFDERTFSSSESYEIPVTGYYDIEIVGALGSDSYITPYRNGDVECLFNYAKHGASKIFRGTVYLRKGDVFNVKYSVNGIASINLDCGNNSITGKVKSYPGVNGQDITVNVDGNFNVSVLGSNAGGYRCNKSNNCSSHYLDEKGEDSTLVINSGGFYRKSFEDVSENDITGIVKLKWSDVNSSPRVFVAKGGCGGSSGSINTFLYPVLLSKLPDLKIGRGGSNYPEYIKPEATTFGSMIAKEGKSNSVCNNENEKDGSKGVSFSVSEDIIYKGGDNGVSGIENINGGHAEGFAAGGGGGAVYYSTLPIYDVSKTIEENESPLQNGVVKWNQGSGGNGGSGLIVITW